MSQPKKLSPVARKGGSALTGPFRRAGAAARRIPRFVASCLGRFGAWARRSRVAVIVVSLIVLSYCLGYLNGVGTVGRIPAPVDTGVSGSDAGTGASIDIGLPVDEGAIGMTAAPQAVESVLPERVVRSAVAPIDGAVVSGPDWVKDPTTGDWFYSYEVLMESTTSGTVRSALDGVVRSVTNEGGMWTIRVDHEDGSIISYGWLSEADVGPGLTVASGQRIGLAAEAESGFRVSLNAVADGEPCSATDLIF